MFLLHILVQALLIFNFILINKSLAQNNSSCDQVRLYSGPSGYIKEEVFNIPPGQPKGLILHEYYAAHFGIPDGVEIYINGAPNPIATIWVGDSGFCKANANGKTESNCVRGPVEWSNENNPNGAGTLTNMLTTMTSQEVEDLFLNEGIYSGSGGNLRVKLYTTEDICQIKFVIRGNSTESTSLYHKIKCPSLVACPSEIPIKVEQSCNKVAVSANICSNYYKQLTWSSSLGNTVGHNVDIKKIPGGGNLDVTLNAKISDTCEIKQSIKVDRTLLQILDTSATDATCNNSQDGAASVEVSGGIEPYLINWNNFSVGANISGLAPGVYTVVVTDAIGCSVTGNATVKTKEDIKLKLNPENVPCFGDNTGNIFSNIQNQHGNVSYLWSNGKTTSNLFNIPAGTYFVTVTDEKGCTAKESVMVDQPESALKVDFNFNATICEKSASGSIELKPSGGTAPYKTKLNGVYQGDQKTFDNLLSGNYDIQVVDAHGCLVDQKINIPVDNTIFEAKVTADGCLVSAELTLKNSQNEIIKKLERNDINVAPNAKTIPLTLDFHGCHFEDEFNIDGAVTVNIPNVFSPNNDNVNDIFYPKAAKPIIMNSLQIFDRWGNLVFNNNTKQEIEDDPSSGWDGTIGGQVAGAGVYVYRIELGCGKIITGDVTLLR